MRPSGKDRQPDVSFGEHRYITTSLSVHIGEQDKQDSSAE